MMDFKEYRRDVMHTGVCTRAAARILYKDYVSKMKNITATNIPENLIRYSNPYLGNCQATTPCMEVPFGYFPSEVTKQEGNNPMCISKHAAYATPVSTTALSSLSIAMPTLKSDEMFQREYLIEQFNELTGNTWRYDCWYRKAVDVLRKTFNMDAPISPKSSQELIDAFKSNAITIDQKKVDAQAAFLIANEMDQDDLWEEGIRDRYYGITFTSLPISDPKGYGLAIDALAKAQKDTKHKIMISSPADGLTALMALEAWTYTPVTLH